jgi:hypothetical protein
LFRPHTDILAVFLAQVCKGVQRYNPLTCGRTNPEREVFLPLAVDTIYRERYASLIETEKHMRPHFAPFMDEPSRPEPHALVYDIATWIEQAPIAWRTEDTAKIVTALASVIKRRGPLYDETLLVLDKCFDGLDNLITEDCVAIANETPGADRWEDEHV